MHWKEIVHWDVLSADFESRFVTSFEVVGLGQVSKVRRELATNDQLRRREIKMVDRVSFGGQIFAGSKLKTKMDQWIARPGDLLVSKIRARQGSVGLVSQGHGPISATIHYRSLIPDARKADSIYLWLVLRSEYGRCQFLAATGGAMKGEISEERLMDINIPFPSLTCQRSIVSYWQNAQRKIGETEAAACSRETDLSLWFLEQLGLEEEIVSVTQRAIALKWNEVERWGVVQARMRVNALSLETGKFPTVCLGDVVADLKNGWSPKCHDRPAGIDEWGVLKLGAVSYGTFNDQDHKALPKSFKPRSSIEVRKGDVLFVRGNVLRLVGACSYVHTTREKLMLPDLIFRAVFHRKSDINPRYLALLMGIPHLRLQIEAIATGTSPTMKKISKPGLLGLRLPLPALDVQRQLVAHASDERNRIVEDRFAANRLSEQTAKDIEGMILGHIPVPA